MEWLLGRPLEWFWRVLRYLLTCERGRNAQFMLTFLWEGIYSSNLLQHHELSFFWNLVTLLPFCGRDRNSVILRKLGPTAQEIGLKLDSAIAHWSASWCWITVRLCLVDCQQILIKIAVKVFPSLLPLHFTVHQRSLTERLNLKVHLSHKPNNEGGKGGRGYTKYGLSGLSLMFPNDDVY